MTSFFAIKNKAVSFVRTLSSCVCCSEDNDSPENVEPEGSDIHYNPTVPNDNPCCSYANLTGVLEGLDSYVQENEGGTNISVEESPQHSKEDSTVPKSPTEEEEENAEICEDSSILSNLDLRVKVETASEENSEFSHAIDVHPCTKVRNILIGNPVDIKVNYSHMMEENLKEETFAANEVEKSDVSSTSVKGVMMVKCTAITESSCHGIGDSRFCDEKKSEDGKNVDQDLVKSSEEDQSYSMSNTVETFNHLNMDKEERNDNFCDDCTLEFMQELEIQPSEKIQNFKWEIGSKILWCHALSITLQTFHVKFTNVLNFYQIDCLIMFECVCRSSQMLLFSWSLYLLEGNNEVTSHVKYYAFGKVALNLMMNGKLLHNDEITFVVELGETLSRRNTSDSVFVLSTMNHTENNSSLKKLKILKNFFKSNKNILKCVIGSLNGQMDSFYTVCPVSGKRDDTSKRRGSNQHDQRQGRPRSDEDVIDYIPPMPQQLLGIIEQSEERSQLVNQGTTGHNQPLHPGAQVVESNLQNIGSPQYGSSVDVLDHIPRMPQQLSGIIEQLEERSQLVNQGTTGHNQLLHPDAQVEESNLQNIGNSENCTGLPVGDQSPQQSITRNPTTLHCDRTQQITPSSENQAATSYTTTGIHNRNAQTDGGRQLCQDGNNVLPYPDVRANLSIPHNASSPQDGSSVDVLDHIPRMPQQLSGIIEQLEERTRLVNQGTTGHNQPLHPGAQVEESNLQNIGNSENCTGLLVGDQSPQQSITRNPTTSHCDRTQQITPSSENQAATSYTTTGIHNRNAQTDGGRQLCQDGNNVLPYPDVRANLSIPHNASSPQYGSSVDVLDHIPRMPQQLSGIIEQLEERSQLVNQGTTGHNQPLHSGAQVVESNLQNIGNSENCTGLPVGDQSPQQSITRNPTTLHCDRTQQITPSSENQAATSYTTTGIHNRNAQTDGGRQLCQDGNNVLPYPDVRANLSNPHNARRPQSDEDVIDYIPPMPQQLLGIIEQSEERSQLVNQGTTGHNQPLHPGSPQYGSSVDVLDHIPPMPQQLLGIIEQSEERSQLVNQGTTGHNQPLHPGAQVEESNLQNIGNSENCTGLPVGDQSPQQSFTRNRTTSHCDRTQQITPSSENQAATSCTTTGIHNRNAQTDGGRQLYQDGNNVLPYPDVRANLSNPHNARVSSPCFPSQGHRPIVCTEHNLYMFNLCPVLCGVGPLSSWLSSPQNRRLFERYADVLSQHHQLYQDLLEMSRHFNADPPNFGLAVALWIKHLSGNVINLNAVRSRTGLRNVDLSNSQLESMPLHLSSAAYSCCFYNECHSFCTEGTMLELPCILLGTPERAGGGVSFQDFVDYYFLGYDGQHRRCSFCNRESILTLHPMPPVVIFNPQAVLQYINTSADIPEFISIYGYRYRRLIVSFWRDRHLTAVAWIEQLQRNMYYDCNDYRRDQPELGILHEYTEDPVGATIQMIVYVLCPDPQTERHDGGDENHDG